MSGIFSSPCHQHIQMGHVLPIGLFAVFAFLYFFKISFAPAFCSITVLKYRCLLLCRIFFSTDLKKDLIGLGELFGFVGFILLYYKLLVQRYKFGENVTYFSKKSVSFYLPEYAVSICLISSFSLELNLRANSLSEAISSL